MVYGFGVFVKRNTIAVSLMKHDYEKNYVVIGLVKNMT